MYAIAEIDVKIFFSLEVQKSFSLIGSRIIFTVCLDFTKLVEKWFLAFCLIGFLTTFKLLCFVLSFVLHRFGVPALSKNKWYTPLCSCYFSRHTRACTTHLDMCLLFILKLAWTQGRVPLNDMYILFKRWCVYGNRNKWYTDWYTRL